MGGAVEGSEKRGMGGYIFFRAVKVGLGRTEKLSSLLVLPHPGKAKSGLAPWASLKDGLHSVGRSALLRVGLLPASPGFCVAALGRQRRGVSLG